MSAPTRRTVLAGLSAAGLTVPALAALPAVAAGHPDAELFRIVHEFEDARAAWEVADAHERDLSHLAHKEYPAPARAISRKMTRTDGSTWFMAMEREEIEAARWSADEEETRRWKLARLAERDAYDTAREVIAERYGLPEAKARSSTLINRYIEAEKLVYRTPAKTAEGIAAKLRVVIQEHAEDEIGGDTLALILADAERIGGAS